MYLSVPVSIWNLKFVGDFSELVELVGEIIKDDDSFMVFSNVSNSFVSTNIVVGHLSKQIKKFSGFINWFVIPRIPAIFPNPLVQNLVIVASLIQMSLSRMTLNRKRNGNINLVLKKNVFINKAFNLWVLGKPRINTVLSRKLRLVPVKTISNKYRNIIRNILLED